MGHVVTTVVVPPHTEVVIKDSLVRVVVTVEKVSVVVREVEVTVRVVVKVGVEDDGEQLENVLIEVRVNVVSNVFVNVVTIEEVITETSKLVKVI